MAVCNDCEKGRGLEIERQDDGKPDLLWCCLNCGHVVCRGCLEGYQSIGDERICKCGYLITGNQRIDNNQDIAW